MAQVFKTIQTLRTPQSEPILRSNQVSNSAGGFAWRVDDWVRLDRFLFRLVPRAARSTSASAS